MTNENNDPKYVVPSDTISFECTHTHKEAHTTHTHTHSNSHRYTDTLTHIHSSKPHTL